MYRQVPINHVGVGLIDIAAIPSEQHYLVGAGISAESTGSTAPETMPAEFYGAIRMCSADSPSQQPLLTLAFGPIGGIADLSWQGRIFLDPQVIIRFYVHSWRAYRFLCTIWTEL